MALHLTHFSLGAEGIPAHPSPRRARTTNISMWKKYFVLRRNLARQSFLWLSILIGVRIVNVILSILEMKQLIKMSSTDQYLHCFGIRVIIKSFRAMPFFTLHSITFHAINGYRNVIQRNTNNKSNKDRSELLEGCLD